MSRERIRAIATAALPVSVRGWIRAQQRRYRLQWRRVGTLDLGPLGRVTPISPVFAVDRGLAVDRYYIDRFLGAHRADVRGRVLEIGDDLYTRQFGDNRVTRSDVLHVVSGNPRATIVADLTRADHIPTATFDCIILTQTLQMIYDMRAALRHLARILAPGGVLLATSHGISRIGRREGVDDWGEYWRLTAQSARRLFEEAFPAPSVRVEVYGSVLTAVAVLHGLAAVELTHEQLDYHDPDYEVLIGVRAAKRAPLGAPTLRGDREPSRT